MEVVGALGMGRGLGAQTMAHLEHSDPARKDTERFVDRLRKRRNHLSLRTKLTPTERTGEIITREQKVANNH